MVITDCERVVVYGSETVTLGGRGWFGTGQVGCDYQVDPSIVIGAFGDGDFSSIKGHLGNVDETLSWSWAAGGRIGYVALPNLLAYVSGGFTEAHFDQLDVYPNAIGYSGDNLSWLVPRIRIRIRPQLYAGPVLEDRISLRRLPGRKYFSYRVRRTES